MMSRRSSCSVVLVASLLGLITLACIVCCNGVEAAKSLKIEECPLATMSLNACFHIGPPADESETLRDCVCALVFKGKWTYWRTMTTEVEGLFDAIEDSIKEQALAAERSRDAARFKRPLRFLKSLATSNSTNPMPLIESTIKRLSLATSPPQALLTSSPSSAKDSSRKRLVNGCVELRAPMEKTRKALERLEASTSFKFVEEAIRVNLDLPRLLVVLQFCDILESASMSDEFFKQFDPK